MFVGMQQTVNYHLTEECNMHCAFCFAKYDLKEKKQLSRVESLALIDHIARAGCKKLTFVGGEPTLCPWLPDLIQRAKEHDLVTMLITNGTGLTDFFLNAMQSYLDWIGMSVNSLDLCSLKVIGTQCKGQVIDGDYYYRTISNIVKYGYPIGS